MDLSAALATFALGTCGATRVEVHAAGATIEADDFQFDGDPCHGHPELRVTAFTDGVAVARAMLQPSLSVWVAVPVAAEATAAGQPVRRVPGEALAARVIGDPVPADAVVRARVALAKGEPVTTALTEPVPDAVQGGTVDILVRRGSVALVAPGRLLEDGVLGQPVRVRSDVTQTSLSGILRDPRTVEIP